MKCFSSTSIESADVNTNSVRTVILSCIAISLITQSLEIISQLVIKTVIRSGHFQVMFSFLLLLLVPLQQIYGSTLLAVKCNDGIVLGYDSSTDRTARSVGSLSRWTQKLFSVTPYTVICTAGSLDGKEAVDFENLLVELKEEIFRYGFDHLQEEKTLSTDGIYCVMKRLIRHKYKLAHAIIAGINHDRDTHLSHTPFRVYEILPGGTALDDTTFAAAGSGSSTVLSLLEDLLGGSLVMSVEAARPIVQRVLEAALRLDQTSGGEPVLWTLSKPVDP